MNIIQQSNSKEKHHQGARLLGMEKNEVKEELKHLNNHCPNIRTYHLENV